jgi:hypothetical protein
MLGCFCLLRSAVTGVARAPSRSFSKALGSRQQERALQRSFVDHYLGEGGRTSLMFTVRDGVGSLSKVLSLFEAHSVNLTRIESKPSKRGSAFDFVVDTSVAPPAALLESLAAQTSSHTLLAPRRVPWFPTSIKDIDAFSTKTLDAGADLEADHPGFSDAAYRQRRHDIVARAARHKHGEDIPEVAYTANELATWRVVYDKLRGYTQEFACDSYNRVFPLLEQHCGYAPDHVPQLQDISAFLLSCTGFRVRPVGGLLSARDFLNGLAFRVFFSTQYMRHHSVPLYTPEPDVCHELLGHVPMFADPDFADFSHEIGLASLGASDEDIKRLAAVRARAARACAPAHHSHPSPPSPIPHFAVLLVQRGVRFVHGAGAAARVWRGAAVLLWGAGVQLRAVPARGRRGGHARVPQVGPRRRRRAGVPHLPLPARVLCGGQPHRRKGPHARVLRVVADAPVPGALRPVHPDRVHGQGGGARAVRGVRARGGAETSAPSVILFSGLICSLRRPRERGALQRAAPGASFYRRCRHRRPAFAPPPPSAIAARP